MTTHHLKFADEAEAKTALAQYLDEEGNWMTASHIHALDVVGTIYKFTGEVINDEPVSIELDGYHINYIGDADFSAYEVFPSTPSRVFA